MKQFQYINGEACVEEIPLKNIAEEFGTPCYVYSRQIIEENYLAFDRAFTDDTGHNYPHQICYAVKANSNLAVLNILARLGSGFDIVSAGELERVLAAGGDPSKVVFSGVGKQTTEIERALAINISCFNVESAEELERIQAIAERVGVQAAIALRINPNIDAMTHPYIATGLKDNKFGIELNTIPNLLQKLKAMPNITLIGIACHIGSQLTTLEPFIEVIECLHDLYLQLLAAGFSIQHINVGGGLGVRYKNENPPTRETYVSAIKARFSPYAMKIILEPGRSIIADAGILLTRIEYIKSTSNKNFAIVDAAMNDFLRPALYHAWQDIVPALSRSDNLKNYDIVGPVCESADFLGRDRQLRIQSGDLLCILMAGAYGFSMSSNYNSRTRPAEIMINKAQVNLIRRRETVTELFTSENILG